MIMTLSARHTVGAPACPDESVMIIEREGRGSVLVA
jgi:hypothetical protein